MLYNDGGIFRGVGLHHNILRFQLSLSNTTKENSCFTLWLDCNLKKETFIFSPIGQSTCNIAHHTCLTSKKEISELFRKLRCSLQYRSLVNCSLFLHMTRSYQRNWPKPNSSLIFHGSPDLINVSASQLHKFTLIMSARDKDAAITLINFIFTST